MHARAVRARGLLLHDSDSDSACPPLHEEKMDDELTPSLRQEGVKYAAESLDFCGDQPCDFSQAKYKSACTLDSER